jgi:hypothetical protein
MPQLRIDAAICRVAQHGHRCDPVQEGRLSPAQVMKRFLHIEVPRWRAVLEHMAIGLILLVLESLLAVGLAQLL